MSYQDFVDEQRRNAIGLAGRQCERFGPSRIIVGKYDDIA